MKAKQLQHLSTENATALDKLAYWRNAMRQAGVGGQLKPTGHGSFRASLAQYDLGTALLTYWNSDAIENDRTVQDCAQYPSAQVCLSVLRKGWAFIEQRGRKLEVVPGECFLIHSDLPSYFKAEPYESMTITLPNLATTWVSQTENHTALPLTKQSEWGKVLSALLLTMTEDNIMALPVHPGLLVEQVTNLLALTIAGDGQKLPRTHKQSQFRRLRQHLQVHSHDCALTPDDVARKNRVSVRTLHATFAEAGTTFGRELLNIRMGKAAQVLSDPQFSRKTVSEIATLLGYKATSHFIAHFKRSYGVSPQRYRNHKTGPV